MLRFAAILSWFAGPVAASISIPVVEHNGQSPQSLPPYVSLAALADIRKIRLIGVEAAQRIVQEGRVILLVRERDITRYPLAAPVAPMHGSQRLDTGCEPESGPGTLRYYYIGDPESDLQDAYYAACLAYWAQGGEDAELLTASRSELMRLRDLAASFEKISLFGTGPSIAEALDQDHRRTFNVVCNTIIKNRAFVDRLSPKMLVASDAHFHFSCHRYSARFLADVVEFLRRGDGSFFTFDKFAVFARLRLPSVAHRIFGIPAGREAYGYDFDRDFRLFPGDSVLNMFLLPLGSFLGDEVALHGFTGRAPTDNYFWSHSELHQYTDLMESVRLAHPAFFRNRDYGGYAGNVDDEIAQRVTQARVDGKNVHSQTTTFYRVFAQ